MFLASHAMGLVQNGMLSSSVSLANNPAIPVATEQVTFTATVASGAAGTMVLANLTVELAYGNGSTDTSTTNSNGQAMFNHTYATAGSFPVVASFAGKLPSFLLLHIYCQMLARWEVSCQHAATAMGKQAPFMRHTDHIHASYGMS